VPRRYPRLGQQVRTERCAAEHDHVTVLGSVSHNGRLRRYRVLRIVRGSIPELVRHDRCGWYLQRRSGCDHSNGVPKSRIRLGRDRALRWNTQNEAVRLRTRRCSRFDGWSRRLPLPTVRYRTNETAIAQAVAVFVVGFAGLFRSLRGVACALPHRRLYEVHRLLIIARDCDRREASRPSDSVHNN